MWPGLRSFREVLEKNAPEDSFGILTECVSSHSVTSSLQVRGGLDLFASLFLMSLRPLSGPSWVIPRHPTVVVEVPAAPAAPPLRCYSLVLTGASQCAADLRGCRRRENRSREPV